jgi:hypothetical protein
LVAWLKGFIGFMIVIGRAAAMLEGSLREKKRFVLFRREGNIQGAGLLPNPRPPVPLP